MPLAAGTRLGPYEVLGLIGAGGPAFARGEFSSHELRRGLAEAKPRSGP
jgi:hypothetical protein